MQRVFAGLAHQLQPALLARRRRLYGVDFHQLREARPRLQRGAQFAAHARQQLRHAARDLVSSSASRAIASSASCMARRPGRPLQWALLEAFSPAFRR